jgi:hypothetical protein
MADLTVEDGTNIPGANSYVSIEEADEYLTIRPNYSSWEDVEDQDFYLIWATQLLDQRAKFSGVKTFNDSALRWPRVGACDRDGLPVGGGEIPEGLRQATIEIAYYLSLNATKDPSLPDSSNASGIKRIKADVVEIEYQDNSLLATGQNYFPLGLNYLLKGLGTLPGATKGGYGAGRIKRA